MMTMTNVGVAITITMNVLTTRKEVNRKERVDLGMTSSMVYMSLAKRLRTRPSGVVSKNDIGDRSMFLSIMECSVVDPKMDAKAREKAAKSTKMTCPAENTAYIPR